jgi:hypothetical protein
MRSKRQASIECNGKTAIHNGAGHEVHLPSEDPSVFAAVQSNIQESLDELEILRGTLQYWESRPAATDPRERAILTEAFRVMHGELLGLTARTRELIEREEQAAKG